MNTNRNYDVNLCYSEDEDAEIAAVDNDTINRPPVLLVLGR